MLENIIKLMKHPVIKKTFEGLLLGYFIVSPAIMIISDKTHKFLSIEETKRMMESDFVGITEVFSLSFWPWALTFTVSSGLIIGIISFFSNKVKVIQEEKTKALLYQATHDSLTGLYNREAFADQLKFQLIQRNSVTVIFFIDLDGFKQANDNFSHDIGNQILIEVANRLCSNLRKSDYICRYGGDEFIMIVGCDENRDYKKLSERILESVSKPYLDGEINFITCSIGIALSEKRDTADTLINKADLAMYSAKKAGKNNFVLYETSSKSPSKSPVINIQYISR